MVRGFRTKSASGPVVDARLHLSRRSYTRASCFDARQMLRPFDARQRILTKSTNRRSNSTPAVYDARQLILQGKASHSFQLSKNRGGFGFHVRDRVKTLGPNFLIRKQAPVAVVAPESIARTIVNDRCQASSIFLVSESIRVSGPRGNTVVKAKPTASASSVLSQPITGRPRTALQSQSFSKHQWANSVVSADSEDIAMETDAANEPSSSTRVEVKPPKLDRKPLSAATGCVLRVSNLADSVTVDDMRDLFSSLGTVKSVCFLGAGTAEVIYTNCEDAQTAVNAYNHRTLDGLPMDIEIVENAKKLPKVSWHDEVLQKLPNIKPKQLVASSSTTTTQRTVARGSDKQAPEPDRDLITEVLFNKNASSTRPVTFTVKV